MAPSAEMQELLENYRSGYSLEQGFYRSPEIYEAEIREILMPHWIFAGHTSRIPDVGDYFLFELDTESVIVSRGRDGAVRAWMNVCRHRGSHICLEESGNVKRFTCPYHAWTYGLDGALKTARQMPEDFDKADWGLHPVNLELVGGMIFLCLSDNPPSLLGMKDRLKDMFTQFQFDNLKQVAEKRYLINANWKLAVENYQECYHCAPSHPEYANFHAMKLDPDKLEPLQAAMEKRMPAYNLSTVEADQQYDLAEPGEEGYHFSRTAMFEGCESGGPDGKQVAPLLGKISGFDFGASDWFVGPVSYFLIYNDHIVGYRFLPKNLHECYCDVFWFVAADAVEGTDYDLERLTWLWDITTQADERIIVNNQKGVNSRFYAPGRFSDMEDAAFTFVEWYVKQLKNAA